MERRRLLLVVAAVIAALGVALVFLYARGAEARAAAKFETVEVLTASQQINPGESIDDALKNGKVALKHIAKAQLLEGASKDSDPIRGKVALTTIYPGEQLVPVKFGGADEVEAAAVLPIPEGMLAMGISVDDPNRVGTFVRPGAEVAVFVTQEGAFSRLLLSRVTVLAAGETTSVPQDEESEESESEDEAVLTLALTQKQVEKVQLAQTLGTLSLALLNGSSELTPDGGVRPGEIFQD